MKTIPVVFGVVLFAVLVAGIVWWSMGESSRVTFIDAFPTHAVYTTDTTRAEGSFRDDCADRGGVFNACGSPCERGADACASICAYTCVFDEGVRNGSGDGVDDSQQENSVGADDHSLYSVSEYDFKIRYPRNDWSVYVAQNPPVSLAYNFYQKPSGIPLDMPLNHFANVTHVSVYPEGIPTEGLFGDMERFTIAMEHVDYEESTLYVLEDGTPFAAKYVPTKRPESWNDAGFVWGRVRIANLEATCIRDGETVSSRECDPMTRDDRIVRNGSVDGDVWDRVVRVMESFAFTENDGAVGDDTGLMHDAVRVTEPQEGAMVTTPVVVEGSAIGPWYSGGMFTVEVQDASGDVVGEAPAQAQEDWMTTDFVPFRAEIELDATVSGDDSGGAVVLRKANPSGLPENAESVRIPVQFR